MIVLCTFVPRCNAILINDTFDYQIINIGSLNHQSHQCVLHLSVLHQSPISLLVLYIFHVIYECIIVYMFELYAVHITFMLNQCVYVCPFVYVLLEFKKKFFLI